MVYNKKTKTYILIFLMVPCLGTAISPIYAETDVYSKNNLQDSVELGIVYAKKIMNEVLDSINKDSTYLYNRLYFERTLHYLYNRNIDFREEVYDFYINIITKSANSATIQGVVQTILDLSYHKNKRPELLKIIRPKLIKYLSAKYLSIRLWAADQLFNFGFKEDAYPLYCDIISRPNVKHWLDKEYRTEYQELIDIQYKKITDEEDHNLKVGNDRSKQKNNKSDIESCIEILKGKLERIEFIKMNSIHDVLHKLITYNDKKTYELVEKIVRDDPWVHAIVYNPMSLIDTTKGIYHRSEKVSKNNNKIDIYLKMKAK